MSDDNKDISKLLGQIKLPDFPYRAFGRDEPTALRVVRSASKAPELAPPATEAKPANEPAVAVSVAGTPATALAPAAPQASARVGEAFERLARATTSSGVPRLHLQLNLRTRPAAIAAAADGCLPGRLLGDVFERLSRAALLTSTQQRAGGGS